MRRGVAALLPPPELRLGHLRSEAGGLRSAPELKKGGFDAPQLRGAGYDAAELKAGPPCLSPRPPPTSSSRRAHSEGGGGCLEGHRHRPPHRPTAGPIAGQAPRVPSNRRRHFAADVRARPPRQPPVSRPPPPPRHSTAGGSRSVACHASAHPPGPRQSFWGEGGAGLRHVPETRGSRARAHVSPGGLNATPPPPSARGTGQLPHPRRATTCAAIYHSPHPWTQTGTGAAKGSRAQRYWPHMKHFVKMIDSGGHRGHIRTVN